MRLPWVLGFALALPLLHFTSWSWPRLWPVDATARLWHSGALLVLWAAIELGLGAIISAARRPDHPGQASPPSGDSLSPRAPRLLTITRWFGRGFAVALILAVLLHAYLQVIGWTSLGLAVAAGAALVPLASASMAAAQRQHHPSLPWAAQFIAALGGAAVLILGRTATAGQATAGLAALAAATALATLIAPRCAPGSVATFLWSGTFAWLLAVGCFATGQTNLASSVLILAVPWAWALPRRWCDIDLLWKRLPLTTFLAALWTVLCVAAAVVLAAITQESAPEPYDF